MSYFDILTRELLEPRESSQFSRTEIALLRRLAEHGPSTMSELSSSGRLALSSATGVVDRLVERQAVERTRPENDRRTVQVTLTPRGRRALEAFTADRIRLGVGMLERLPARERQALLDLFRKMASST